MKVKGKNSNKRDTMEFLKETQRYIDFIRKPTENEEKGSLSPRSLSPSQGKNLCKSKPVTATLNSERPIFNSLSIPQYRPSTRPQLPSPINSNNRSTPEPPSPRKVERMLTLPANLVEPGFGEVPEFGGMEEYLVTNYMHPRSLIPIARKPTKLRRQHPLQSQELEDFLNRFEKKQEPNVAPPVNKGLAGWKLTMGSKTARARTSLMTSRSEVRLKKTFNTSESRSELNGYPLPPDTS